MTVRVGVRAAASIALPWPVVLAVGIIAAGSANGAYDPMADTVSKLGAGFISDGAVRQHAGRNPGSHSPGRRVGATRYAD